MQAGRSTEWSPCACALNQVVVHVAGLDAARIQPHADLIGVHSALG